MFFKIVILLVVLYIALCIVIYLFQEKLIFFPQKLDKDFRFSYPNSKEIAIKTNDGILLNSIFFKSKDTKGVIFYLHGNAGSLARWGDVATTYTSLDYDVFMPDYRGFGKSEGRINNERQVYSDTQKVYDYLKTRYDERSIIILGYSIGTGPATKIASENNPRLLILQAPYYNLSDLAKHTYPFLPSFLLKYKFESNRFIQQCTMPIIIFHGDQDEMIYYGSSVKLKKVMKTTDTLITLVGQGHNGMSSNPQYLAELKKILE
jgi:pimeloyl-ACP methyl ester carboxylesterase